MSERIFEPVAVVGARSQIGTLLLPKLRAAGRTVLQIGRERGSNRQVHVFDDASRSFTPALKGAEAIVSLAPLPSIVSVLEMADALGVKRIIAFGSTGTRTKAGSSSALERSFVEQQSAAESLLMKGSAARGIAWTLFRPTMIYGLQTDQNVAFIHSVIRRFGVFPLPIGARGLRQPVHADDLAAACVSALDCERTFNKAYDLGGGERLEYGELVRRVFEAEGKKAKLLPVPVQFLTLAVALVGRTKRYNFVRQEMVVRMFRDLIADNDPAQRDFGYAPRGFQYSNR